MAIGQIIGALSDAVGHFVQRKENRRGARMARDFTQHMMMKRHQWEVDDLIAAGLNPILSAHGTPSIGSTAQSSVSEPRMDRWIKGALMDADLQLKKDGATAARAAAAQSEATAGLKSAETAFLTGAMDDRVRTAKYTADRGLAESTRAGHERDYAKYHAEMAANLLPASRVDKEISKQQAYRRAREWSLQYAPYAGSARDIGVGAGALIGGARGIFGAGRAPRSRRNPEDFIR